jgi:hypothetical protein
MRTITIYIINDKSIQLLQDLESLHPIRVRREKTINESDAKTNWEVKYKGAMQKQSVIEIDKQLDEIRIEGE